MKRTPYKCGQCGFTSLKMIDLHQHLLDHSGSVGYFYDIGHKTAFPKWKYDDSLVRLNVYTQTEEGVSIEDQLSSDHPEIIAEVSTIVKTEMFDVDIDLQNDFEITSQEDISDIGLEFYEENLAFHGSGDSEVGVSDEEYSEPIQNLSSSNCITKQIKRSNVHQKKSENRNPGKQLKTTQLTQKMYAAERSNDDGESQSVVRFQFEDTNAEEEEYQFPIEYLTASDNVKETDTNKNKVLDLETLTDDEFYQVELTDKNTYEHKCTACSFSCPTKYKLMVHISKYCGKISYICEVCGTVVANKQELSRHKKSCYRKRHKCDICDAAYKRPWMLREHQRVHSGECPFVCDQCGKAFRKKPHLFKHQKSMHSDEKNYKCDQCGKTFKFNWGLTKHLRIHNNVLVYSCQFCEKKFSSSWNLKAHIRQHTGNKPYPCSKCGISFTHNVSRKNHEAKCEFIPGDNETCTSI